MTAAASTMLRTYAAQEWPLINHKGRVARLARKLSAWSDRRVRAVYNGEPSVSLRAAEMADIERLTNEARAEHRALEQRIAALEALLFGTDEAFHSEQVAAQVAYARGRLAAPSLQGERVREGGGADVAGGAE